MTKEQMVLETTEIVKRILKHSDFKLTDETTAGEIKGWDSLSHMVIITEIEKHFNVKFTFAEIMNFETMGEIFSIIMNKLQ